MKTNKVIALILALYSLGAFASGGFSGGGGPQDVNLRVVQYSLIFHDGPTGNQYQMGRIEADNHNLDSITLNNSELLNDFINTIGIENLNIDENDLRIKKIEFSNGTMVEFSPEYKTNSIDALDGDGFLE